MKSLACVALFLFSFFFVACRTISDNVSGHLETFTLERNASLDPGLQSKLEEIDGGLRDALDMPSGTTAIGLLDLRTLRLAMIDPDRSEYAASLPKLGILLAYFQCHPEAPRKLSSQTRHELGLMVKSSDNEMATKYSRELGLQKIQEVLNSYRFYDSKEGGGIWMGKHYGKSDERLGDPLHDHSHSASVRQLLRYFLLLEQGKLVSPEASKAMREILASPGIPHDEIKFVQGLKGRPVEMIRKWGSWQSWLHDSAIVRGPGRHYILAALTHHPRGDEYLVELAKGVDDLLAATEQRSTPSAFSASGGE